MLRLLKFFDPIRFDLSRIRPYERWFLFRDLSQTRLEARRRIGILHKGPSLFSDLSTFETPEVVLDQVGRVEFANSYVIVICNET